MKYKVIGNEEVNAMENSIVVFDTIEEAEEQINEWVAIDLVEDGVVENYEIVEIEEE